MSEFAYATDNFISTSQSIAEALGITAKTVRTKLKDLENDKYIYDFKFSTGTDSSRSYYIINLSDQKISRHKALALCVDQF